VVAEMIVWIRRHNTMHQGIEVLRCLVAAHAGPQFSYHDERGPIAMGHPPSIIPEGIECYPQIITQPGCCSHKSLRRNTDHCQRMPRDLNRLAHNSRVCGIARLPERVTQNYLGNGAWTGLFLRQKEAAQHWLDAEHVEKVRRHVRNISALRLRSSRQRDPIVTIGKHSREGVVLLAQIAIVEI